jgi:hypothetical protein
VRRSAVFASMCNVLLLEVYSYTWHMWWAPCVPQPGPARKLQQCFGRCLWLLKCGALTPAFWGAHLEHCCGHDDVMQESYYHELVSTMCEQFCVTSDALSSDNAITM